MQLSLIDKYIIGMRALNITQNDIASELGYTRNYICMLINGKRHNSVFDKWMDKNVLFLFRNKRNLKK